MRELGTATQQEHERVAEVASQVLDAVYLVGPLMKQFAQPFFEKNEVQVQTFTSASQAATALAQALTPDTVLLVKGSQNTLLLEIAIERLLADPAQADKLLARRGAYWDKERTKLLT